MRLLPAERILALVIAAIAVLDIVLISVKSVAIDWGGYVLPAITGLALVAGGQYYRIARGEERIALALGASGLFIIFTLVGSVFNYLLLPIRFSPIDPMLVRIDALFGYNWPAAVGLAAEWPTISKILFFVYFSSLPQLACVVLLLGFSGKAHALWHFLLTGILGVTGCIVIWSFFPSFGPSTLYSISPEIISSSHLGVTPQYGKELLRLSREGPIYISPTNVLGLIGFPSFHTVMACMSVAFLARLRWIFPFALPLNIAMVPAILVHGGHHLSDFFGGVAMFVIAYLLAGKLLSRLATNTHHRLEIAHLRPGSKDAKAPKIVISGPCR